MGLNKLMSPEISHLNIYIKFRLLQGFQYMPPEEGSAVLVWIQTSGYSMKAPTCLLNNVCLCIHVNVLHYNTAHIFLGIG